MDLLRDYPNFKNDIINRFSNLIRMFDLQLISPYEGCYILVGNKCNLKFTYDRGDVFCSFLKINDSYDFSGYNVSLVFQAIYSSSNASSFAERLTYDPIVQIENLSAFIEEHLVNVVEGDFSWLENFNQKEIKEEKLTLYLIDNIEKEHPMSKKFWSGDSSWRLDLERYLRDNNIEI